jgi:hypothetical protein
VIFQSRLAALGMSHISEPVILFMLAVRPARRWLMSRPASVLSDPLPVALALALTAAWVTGSLGLPSMALADLVRWRVRPRNPALWKER